MLFWDTFFWITLCCSIVLLIALEQLLTWLRRRGVFKQTSPDIVVREDTFNSERSHNSAVASIAEQEVSNPTSSVDATAAAASVTPNTSRKCIEQEMLPPPSYDEVVHM
jgi:activator of HSP90 ATPase